METIYVDPENYGIDSGKLREMLEVLEKEAELHSISVKYEGKTILEGAWKPFTLEDPQMMHSLSKTGTAICVGFALDEGKLKLEAPFLDYIREDLPEEYDPALEKMQRPVGFPKLTLYPIPPFTIRYLIHCVIAFLMVGFNIAVKLFFKSFRDEEMLKELEHQRLQSELQYLKYQINPHFFMNTLNNIHALVDIDTGKAKSTIVELSKLMRYVLYEASNKTILLSREVQFLENYVTLMSLRYPEKVSIEKNFPLEVPEVQIPPLLFISFVENAFKHGVSYRKESFVHVVMQLEEGNRLAFRCTNSTGTSSDEQHHGIGLENIRKRLRLLFGNDYTLSITEEYDKFDVLLIIPLL